MLRSHRANFSCACGCVAAIVAKVSSNRLTWGIVGLRSKSNFDFSPSFVVSYSLCQSLETALPVVRHPSALAWSGRQIICRLASNELWASTTKKRPKASGMASSILFLSARKPGSSDSLVTKLKSNQRETPVLLLTEYSQRSYSQGPPVRSQNISLRFARNSRSRWLARTEIFERTSRLSD
jgi:hypothetical protein